MKRKDILMASLPLLLTSCETSFSDSIPGRILAYTNEQLDSYVEIQSATELDSVARFDDALIIVTRSRCSACDKMYQELVPFIEEHHYLIYTVDANYYYECYSSPDNERGEYARLYPQIAGTPTFLFYRNGSLVEAHSGCYAEGRLEDELLSVFLDYGLEIGNDFLPTSWGTYVCDKAEAIDALGYGTDRLERILQEEEKVTVLYTWRRCQDCQEYKERILFPYLQEREGETPLLVYELDGYYLLKRSEDPLLLSEGLRLFSDFCRRFGLDAYPVTDVEGNVAGVAPTVITYEKGTPVRTSVYRNELLPTLNSDNTLSFRQAFYPEVLELRSRTVVRDGDSGSYRKALEEIQEEAEKIEAEQCRRHLQEEL